MKIYTSYYAVMDRLPNGVEPVSISNTMPGQFKSIPVCKELIPLWLIVNQYKITRDEKVYTRQYIETILSKLDPLLMAQKLKNMVGEGNIPCLMCWEKLFCHRHIVADWFNKNGIWCREYSFGGKINETKSKKTI